MIVIKCLVNYYKRLIDRGKKFIYFLFLFGFLLIRLQNDFY